MIGIVCREVIDIYWGAGRGGAQAKQKADEINWSCGAMELGTVAGTEGAFMCACG